MPWRGTIAVNALERHSFMLKLDGGVAAVVILNRVNKAVVCVLD